MTHLQKTLRPNELIIREGRSPIRSFLEPLLVTCVAFLFWYYLRRYPTTWLQRSSEYGIVFMFLALTYLLNTVRKLLIYLNSEIWITNKRIFFKQWVFQTKTNEISFKQIEWVNIIQSTAWKILKFGEVEILYNIWWPNPKKKYFLVTNPSIVKECIQQQMKTISPN